MNTSDSPEGGSPPTPDSREGGSPPPDLRLAPRAGQAGRPPVPARGLAARTAGIDREARFHARLAEMEAAGERRRRAGVRRRAVLAGLGTVAAVAAGLVAGRSLGLAGGAAVGGLVLAAEVAAVGAALLVRRFAARRGASAWDWGAGRHRLLGDPSRRVHRNDGPRGERGPLG